MKIRKLLIPTLSFAGATLASTPLICLTSCGTQATTKELFTIVATAKEKEVTTATTSTWTFDINTVGAINVPSDLDVSIFVIEDSSNVSFQQCTFEISHVTTGLVTIAVGYKTSSAGLSETKDIIGKFKLQLTWKENEKSYKQDIDGFKLTYKFVKQ